MERTGAQAAPRPIIAVGGGWEKVFSDAARRALEEQLPRWMAGRRWFRSKTRPIRHATIYDTIPIGDAKAAYLAFVRVEFTDGDGEDYVLPMSFAAGAEGESLATARPEAVIARLRVGSGGIEGVLYDGVHDTRLTTALLDAVAHRRRLHGETGDIVSFTTPAYRRLAQGAALDPTVMGAEQSNTSIRYGDRLILKLYRRLDEGTSLDLEIGRFLTEHGFQHAPAVAGAMERDGRSLAVVNAFVVNEGDAWSYTLDRIASFYDHVASWETAAPAVLPTTAGLLARAAGGPSEDALYRIGGYLSDTRLLGQRTAELHACLSDARKDPQFAPEPFTLFYQRSLYQSMRNLIAQSWLALDRAQESLPESVRADTRRLLEQEDALLRRFRALVGNKIAANRIRTHGDFHLGQVLYTGSDFVITDFEGEPARALSERRLKRSALRDVAGMIRSFHYAAYAHFFETSGGVPRRQLTPGLSAWAEYWYLQVSAAYLGGYLAASRGTPYLPADPGAVEKLLDAYLLEKAVYEVGYELNNRPAWLGIPVRGVLHLLGA
jgi:maltose alpha-D-glucosyltransferase/alpha-amylase